MDQSSGKGLEDVQASREGNGPDNIIEEWTGKAFAETQYQQSNVKVITCNSVISL